jgi:hypothetical protein
MPERGSLPSARKLTAGGGEGGAGVEAVVADGDHVETLPGKMECPSSGTFPIFRMTEALARVSTGGKRQGSLAKNGAQRRALG